MMTAMMIVRGRETKGERGVREEAERGRDRGEDLGDG